MSTNIGWKMTSLGLRLKILALLVISLLLIAMGVVLVANPLIFGDARLHRIAHIAFVTFVCIDVLGRVLCGAAPVDTLTRRCVHLSIGCQLAAVVFLIAPFMFDRNLEVEFRLVLGVAPAFLLQVGAAILFMRFTRNVAKIVRRPDLATMPKWVLAWFGIGGTSLTVSMVALLLLVLIVSCCGAPYSLGNLFVYVWNERPIFLLPICGVIFLCIVFPFRSYGVLHYQLAKAIDSWLCRNAGGVPNEKSASSSDP